ncbi:hypothetical protein CVT24_005380 [Panaeolus cyanescens]|uniref:F-box domain-containing protein n=1 Tax=Panaeolus cyanescens TaxID=181874 RepID=A0A409Y8R0_9AGAR|nr:hypothetical protein CVT24_005380 [Panaeolus cyanescens]
MASNASCVTIHKKRNMAFPLEVFSLIITNFVTASISKDGSEATVRVLRTLRFVSKTFNQLCEPHLVRNITIPVSQSGSQHAISASALIKANPSLAKLPRTITLSARGAKVADFLLEGAFDEAGPAIEHILSLPNIQHLRIDWGTTPRRTLPCGSNISEAKRHQANVELVAVNPARITQYFTASNGLNTLSISGVKDLPLLQIILIPNLMTLEIKHCTATISLLEAPASDGMAVKIKKGKALSSIKHFTAEHVKIVSPIHIARFFPDVETIYLKEAKWDSFTYCYDLTSEWSSLITNTGILTNSHWMLYPKLTKLSSMGAVEFDVVVNQESDIRQLPVLKELELQQKEKWDLKYYEAIYDQLVCLEVLKIGGDLPTKSYYKTDLSWYALRRVVKQTRHTLKEIHIAQYDLKGFSETGIEVLHDALNSVKGDNVLEVLRLDLSFQLPSLEEFRRNHHTQWRRLESLLVEDKEDFPYLKEVEILVCLKLVTSVLRKEEEGSLKGFLQEPLWQLLTCPRYTVTCKVKVDVKLEKADA